MPTGRSSRMGHLANRQYAGWSNAVSRRLWRPRKLDCWVNPQVTGRRRWASRTKIPVAPQYPNAEVGLSAERHRSARQFLTELKTLYLQLGEPERAKIRAQLNQLRQQ